MPKVIDWERLLQENKIPFIESGPNVKRGEISIRCPFCGSADPSMHMGLNRETGWWSCWRNRAQHSGKSPLRLLMKLLRVPYGVARELAGLGDDYVDPEGFDAMAAQLMMRDGSSGRKEETQRRRLRLDDEFRPIERLGRTRRHFEYLVDIRGFNPGDIDALGRFYGICAGTSGLFSDRIILPYYQDGELVTWTGRAIGASSRRYRDLEVKESILAPKQTLYNHDCMRFGWGRGLVLVEGPFDALKLDYYSRSAGIRAVALSTNSITEAQTLLLEGAKRDFKWLGVMMDNSDKLDLVDSMRMESELRSIGLPLRMLDVPYGAKDAAELTIREITEWSKEING